MYIYLCKRKKNTGDRPSTFKWMETRGNEKTKPRLQLHLNCLRAYWTLPGRSGRSCFEWEETVMTTKLRHVTEWECVSSLFYQTLSEAGIQRPYNKSFWKKGSCSRRSLNGGKITHACDLKCDISNRKCPSIPPGSRQALNESVNH